ncbi:hypothetical protein [Salibacterium aidingense]|uniref:hypothetical protein n=1 Tax=Salibacterium aidingense TaxID=384933 RepID=UPI00040DB05A|nr:hypothetical protein [Salibacterium aidingense]
MNVCQVKGTLKRFSLSTMLIGLTLSAAIMLPFGHNFEHMAPGSMEVLDQHSIS